MVQRIPITRTGHDSIFIGHSRPTPQRQPTRRKAAGSGRKRMRMKPKTKTVYMLRVRMDDSSLWGEPASFPTRKKRDDTAMYARVIGGMRCHSYEEKVPITQAAEPPARL